MNILISKFKMYIMRSKKEMLRGYILFSILIVIGCGVHTNPEEKELQIPTKLSVDIPESIQSKETNNTQKLQKKTGYDKIF